MPWHLPDTTVITGAFTLNGYQYPSNWLALAPQGEKDALGIYWTEPEPVVPTPPSQLTPRQARLILRQYNLLAGVEAVIQSLGEEAQIEWEYCNYVDRSNPLISVIASQAGMTEEQIDQMFIEGNLL